MLNIICVSYDGTWMKRGFTSQYGVGVAIDILTGLVIDYEVMSLYCHGCVDNKTWTGVAIDTLTGLVIDYEVMSLYCHGCIDNKTWTGARERLAWEEAHAPDCCMLVHLKPQKPRRQSASGVVPWININCDTLKCCLIVTARHSKL